MAIYQIPSIGKACCPLLAWLSLVVQPQDGVDVGSLDPKDTLTLMHEEVAAGAMEVIVRVLRFEWDEPPIHGRTDWDVLKVIGKDPAWDDIVIVCEDPQAQGIGVNEDFAESWQERATRRRRMAAHGRTMPKDGDAAAVAEEVGDQL